MATYQARVEDYLGTISDTDALTDQLTAGIKYISDLLPSGKLEKYSADQTDSGSGYTITGGLVLSAHKSYYPAIKVPKEMKAVLSDSDSIHYATARSPKWYIDGGKAYVLPSGGSVNVYAYPTVVYSASTISGFPVEYDQGVVLYAVIQQAIAKMNVAMDALDALSYSAPTPPSAPSDASYSYSNASLGTYTSTTIDYTGISAPTYTKPTISMTAAPSDLTISASAPSAPSAPSFAYTDAALGTYFGSYSSGSLVSGDTYRITDYQAGDNFTNVGAPSNATGVEFTASGTTPTTWTNGSVLINLTALIGSLGSAPTYTTPTTTIDGTVWATAYPNYATEIATALTAINTQVDAGVSLASNFASRLGSAVTALTSADAEIVLANAEADKMAAEVVLANAEFDKATAEVALSNTEADKITTEIGLGKTEIAEAAINVDAAIDTATAAITTANGRINTAVGLANTEFGKVAAIIDLANTEFDLVNTDIDTGSASISTDEDIELGLAEAEIAIKRVQNGEAYLAEARERIQNGNSYLEEAKTSLAESQGYIGEVNARVEQVRTQIEVANGYFSTAKGYAMGADKYAQTAAGYVATGQGYLSTARGYADVADKYLGTANQYINEANGYINTVSGYAQAINSYFDAAKGYATEVQARLANVPAKVSEYNSKMQDALNTFNEELELHKSTVQNAFLQAKLDQDRILKHANDETDLNLKNEAQTLIATIEEYKSSLGKYQEEITSYGAQVNAEVQQYSQNLQKWMSLRDTELKQYSADIQNEFNESQSEVEAYRANIQKAIRQAELDQERLMLSANKTTDLNLQNAAQTLFAAIELYKSKLSKFSQQVSLYSVEVQDAQIQYTGDIQKLTAEQNYFKMIYESAKQEFNDFVKGMYVNQEYN